jgi:WD40 repeat protein
MLASCSGASVTLWDVVTGKEMRTLTPEEKSVFGPVAFSPDWKTLAVSVAEGTSRSIKFWDLTEEKWLESHPVNTNTSRLQYSPDGKMLAQVHREGVSLWDVSRWTPLHTFTGHSFTDRSTPTHVSEAITALVFSPDGRIVATCGPDGTAKLHDVRSGKGVRNLTALSAGTTGRNSGLHDLVFSPDGNSLITAGVYGSLKSWDVSTGREERSLLGHSDDVLCVAISSDGTRLASGGTAGEIKIWEATAGPTQSLSMGHVAYAARPTFSPDGKMLAKATPLGVEVRYLAQARAGLLLDHRSTSPHGIAFSPDSKILTSAGNRRDPESGKYVGEIRCWNLESGRSDRSFPGAGPEETIDRLNWSPDGKTLAITCMKTTLVDGGTRKYQWVVKLLDPETGTETQSFPGTGVAFTPDGQTLAIVGNDQVLKLIDRSSGRELLRLQGRGTARFVTFSRDGKGLFFDGAVWETASGQFICRLEGIDSGAYFSSDGKRLFSVTPSLPPGGSLKVWDATTGDLLLAVNVPAGLELAVHPDGWRCAVSHINSGTWLVDARPLTPELLQQREAHNLVAYLYRKPMFKEDVLRFLHDLKTISEPVRKEALVLAQLQEHDANLLSERSTMILIHADRTPEEYRQALKWAEEANRLAPEVGEIVNTFGVALYRVGKYKDAAAALERSRELNLKASRVNHYATDLLFLAMTQWKLSLHEDARATLQRARDPKSYPQWVMPAHWREAEALIEGKTDEPNK